jgi:hypothetical protein
LRKSKAASKRERDHSCYEQFRILHDDFLYLTGEKLLTLLRASAPADAGRFTDSANDPAPAPGYFDALSVLPSALVSYVPVPSGLVFSPAMPTVVSLLPAELLDPTGPVSPAGASEVVGTL